MRAPYDTAGEVILPRKRRHEKLPSFDSYSDEQWRDIKKIVAELELGFDIDTVRLGISRKYLRDALQDLAGWHINLSQFAGLKRVKRTPRQRAEELRETLDEIERLRGRLTHLIDRDLAPQRARAARMALRALADELQPMLDAASKAGSRSPRNASKPHRRAYLIELEKIWRELVSLQSPQRKSKVQRKLKADFLLACAAPTFGANASVVKHFLDSHH